MVAGRGVQGALRTGPAHAASEHDRRALRAADSPAATVADVVAEVAASTLTERGATRADDRISEAAMEDRKKEGYF